jgi:phage shock protein PspC (stress-responsive transcriptional regulator)
MKKTIRVNLGGLQFTFDEDAYQMMSDYLSSLEIALKDKDDDSAELVNDIEGRCAEILSDKYDRNSYIITIDDIRQLIERMGEPEEIIDIDNSSESNEKETSAPPAPPTEQEQSAKRRLYRSSTDKILGGVCGGIAAYFNIDPTWVRIGFVLLALLSSSIVFWGYIIMWIILPLASTPIQKLQQKGKSLSIKNIGQTVNESFSSDESPYYEKLNTENNQNESKKDSILSVIGKVILIILAIILSPVLIAAAVAIVCLIPIILSIPFGLFANLNSASLNTIAPSITLAIAIVVCIAIPIFFLIYFVLRKFSNVRPMKRQFKIILLIMLAVSFISIPISVNRICKYSNSSKELRENFRRGFDEFRNGGDFDDYDEDENVIIRLPFNNIIIDKHSDNN